ncbi:WG repeat-containing protein [Bacteroides sp. AF39-11AC]|jgi:hypothetical protein|uniref:WG repeat-containing protein n=1 Tax=Bacteroides TaxID=816 RepID=UPI0026CDA79D
MLRQAKKSYRLFMTMPMFFSVELALVRQNGWWGYVDKTGKEVIPFVYEDARYFNKNGKAKVKLNGETFFIDVKGNRAE